MRIHLEQRLGPDKTTYPILCIAKKGFFMKHDQYYFGGTISLEDLKKMSKAIDTMIENYNEQ